MPDLVDAIRKEIDARLEELRPLVREASDLQRALDALNGISAAVKGDRRGRRGQPHRRSVSRRRRQARGDIGALVVEYVAANPGSTASGVADALGLKRSSVATRLTELAKRGDLVKAPRGYSARQGAR
jgi:DNA invertase Pin-like site-specific DNA recombinase